MRAPETRRAFALTGFESESSRHPFNSPVFAKAIREIGRTQAVLGGRDAALDKTLNAAMCDRPPGPAPRGPFEVPNPVLPLLAKPGDQVPPPGEVRPQTGPRTHA
jgi:hypothetical protein